MSYSLGLFQSSYSLYSVSSANANLAEIFKDSESPVFVSKEGKEISVLSPTGTVSKFDKEDAGWRVFKILGEIPLDECGVLKKLLKPLAKNKISALAESTFSTDFIFVKDENITRAIKCLKETGVSIVDAPLNAKS